MQSPRDNDENIVLETPSQDTAVPLLQSGLQSSSDQSDEDITCYQTKPKAVENYRRTRSSMDLQERFPYPSSSWHK
jgi:hypothetical protein